MRNLDLLQKRIARYGEFDNGNVLHGWSEMNCTEAEEIAKQESLENPNDIFYVAYNHLLDTCSDTRWIKRKAYRYTDIVCKNGIYCVEG